MSSLYKSPASRWKVLDDNTITPRGDRDSIVVSGISADGGNSTLWNNAYTSIGVLSTLIGDTSAITLSDANDYTNTQIISLSSTTFDLVQSVSAITLSDANDYTDTSVLWELNEDTITPKISTQTLTLPYLSGNHTIIVSDSNGLFQDSTVTIFDGLTGGSIINLDAFEEDPDTADLINGDMWITNSSATSGKLLKFYDGVHKFSVELSQEV